MQSLIVRPAETQKECPAARSTKILGIPAIKEYAVARALK